MSTPENAPRRKPGRGSQVTPAERREIQHAHVVEGLSFTAIAARFGRTRETIAAQMQGDDFDALADAVEQEKIEAARKTLRQNRQKAADAWGKAINVAADKGDHKPAKDLLIATDVIRPIGESGGASNQVIVIVGMPGAAALTPPSQDEIDAAMRLELTTI